MISSRSWQSLPRHVRGVRSPLRHDCQALILDSGPAQAIRLPVHAKGTLNTTIKAVSTYIRANAIRGSNDDRQDTNSENLDFHNDYHVGG